MRREAEKWKQDLPHGNVIIHLPCRFRPFLDVDEPDLLLHNVHKPKGLSRGIVVWSFGQTGFDIQIQLEFRMRQQLHISIDSSPLSARGSMERIYLCLKGLHIVCKFFWSIVNLTCALYRKEYSVLDFISLSRDKNVGRHSTTMSHAGTAGPLPYPS